MRLVTFLVSFGGVVAPVVAETVLGVAVYTRHGDRNTKHYKSQMLTNLGFQQNFRVGGSYRTRYLLSNSSSQILGISEDIYVPSQVYASAPDQAILFDTATALVQGLYPPLEESDDINNGTAWTKPLGGYQYVSIHGEDPLAPDAIWIKGDEECPTVTEAQSTFKSSIEFKQRLETTKPFYKSFWNILESVYDYQPENMTYANAFDIFDLINVARVHNETSPAVNVTDEELFQLRTLADSAEWALSYNNSLPARSIGGETLAGAILMKLNQTITSKGRLKFSLLSGSYDNFLSFFGISNLTQASPDFFGLPVYASTMAFELFVNEDLDVFPSNVADVNVRFLFRNGSDEGTALTQYPLFGRTEPSMSWIEFAEEMGSRSIMEVEDWCNVCSNTENFCAQFATDAASSPVSESGKSGMSNAVAGVIGAMVTLGVFTIGGLLLFLRRRKDSGKAGAVPANNTSTEKISSSGSSQGPEP